MDPRRRIERHKRRDAANLEWFLALLAGSIVLLVYDASGRPEPGWLWLGLPLLGITIAVGFARHRLAYDEKDRDLP